MIEVKKVFDRNKEVGNKPGDCDYGLEYNMLHEEISETKNAMGEGDLIEIVDGLVDILFVAFGTWYKLDYEHEKLQGVISSSLPVSDIGYIDPSTINKMISSLSGMKTWLNLSKTAQAEVELLSLIVSAYDALCTLLGSELLVLKCYNEVCKSNFSKLPFEKDSNGKIKKGKNFRRPDLFKILRGTLVGDKFGI